MRRHLCWSATVCGWLLNTAAFAQALPPPNSPSATADIESLNLRDLLDVPIFTPSRQVDSVHNAPAIISVITAEEIADMGAETLYDVLNTVPGIEVTETLAGLHTVTIRGVLAGEANNISLLLLNGHPMREFQNSSGYMEAIPVTAIKQIEIVRGPGSVEYGANGFAGVINVITKDGDDPNTNKVQAQYGQYRTADVGASAGLSEGAFSVFLAAQHRNGDGFPETFVDAGGQSTNLRNQNNFDNAYVKINYKDFTLSGQYFRNTKTINELFLTFFHPHGVAFHDGSFAELKYKHALSDAVTFFGTASFDAGRKENDFSVYPWPPASAGGVDAVGLGPAPIAPDYLYSGSRLWVEARVTWQVIDWIKIAGGLQYELNQNFPNPTDPIASMPFERERDEAAFAEVFVNPTESIGLSAGFRFDENSKSGPVAVPRAGIVYSLTHDLSLKLLYGRAFRAPSFNERYWAFWGGDFPQVDPNTLAPTGPAYTLKPEKIDTVELGTDWKLGKHALRVNVFYLNITDLISLSQNGTFYNYVFGGTDTEPRYGNSAGYSAIGAEAELRGYPLPSFFYFVNASTKYAFSGSLSNSLGYRSAVLANVGFTYTTPGLRLKVSTYATLTGPRSGTLSDGRITAAYPDAVQTLPAYVVWNANISYPIIRNFEVALLLHNILNTSYAFPDFSNYGPVVPGQRFAAYGRATLSF